MILLRGFICSCDTSGIFVSISVPSWQKLHNFTFTFPTIAVYRKEQKKSDHLEALAKTCHHPPTAPYSHPGTNHSLMASPFRVKCRMGWASKAVALWRYFRESEAKRTAIRHQKLLGFPCFSLSKAVRPPRIHLWGAGVRRIPNQNLSRTVQDMDVL
jgi:hypothetical protein